MRRSRISFPHILVSHSTRKHIHTLIHIHTHIHTTQIDCCGDFANVCPASPVASMAAQVRKFSDALAPSKSTPWTPSLSCLGRCGQRAGDPDRLVLDSEHSALHYLAALGQCSCDATCILENSCCADLVLVCGKPRGANTCSTCLECFFTHHPPSQDRAAHRARVDSFVFRS